MKSEIARRVQEALPLGRQAEWQHIRYVLNLALLFTQLPGWGLTGAWVAMSIDLGVRGLFMLRQFRLGRWKEMEV